MGVLEHHVSVRPATEHIVGLLLLLLPLAAPQGFPDHHVFVGLDDKDSNECHGKGTKTVIARYMQVCGNVVSWYVCVFWELRRAACASAVQFVCELFSNTSGVTGTESVDERYMQVLTAGTWLCAASSAVSKLTLPIVLTLHKG
jgi:hypothetical protein